MQEGIGVVHSTSKAFAHFLIMAKVQAIFHARARRVLEAFVPNIILLSFYCSLKSITFFLSSADRAGG